MRRCGPHHPTHTTLSTGQHLNPLLAYTPLAWAPSPAPPRSVAAAPHMPDAVAIVHHVLRLAEQRGHPSPQPPQPPLAQHATGAPPNCT